MSSYWFLCKTLCFCFVSLSFESWFDVSTITSDAENIVATEREQNVLHMLHQVSSPCKVESVHLPQCSLAHFKQVFECEQFSSHLHLFVCFNGIFQILTPFLLRRLKSDVTLEVPPKKEVIVYAPLTSKQEELYMAVVNKTITKLLGKEKVEIDSKTHSKLLLLSSLKL